MACGCRLSTRTRWASPTAIRASLVTRAGRATVVVDVDDTMPRGAIALPNGFGVDFPDETGVSTLTGVAPNELTRSEDRDPIAGTPWHKYVPARLEPLASDGAVTACAASSAGGAHWPAPSGRSASSGRSWSSGISGPTARSASTIFNRGWESRATP